MVTDLWHESAKIDIPCLHFVRRHSITFGNIAKPIPIPRHSINLHFAKKNFVNFSAVNHWNVVARLQIVGRCTNAKIGKHICVVFTRVYTLIFTKRSANVERSVGFITVYSNCDGSIKGRCYGNRSETRIGENWHTPSSFTPLAFDNCWEYRSLDYCIKTADDRSTSDKNFTNFGPIISDLVAHLQGVGGCT